MAFYAGIGSRRTPQDVLHLMHHYGRRLPRGGYILRSGAADGADSAFQSGSEEVGAAAEIWLPWRGFNGMQDTHLYPTEAHMEMAATLHPAWDRLTRGSRRLHARNVGQILGADLATPVAFVICWTPDGCENEAQRTRNTGGTGTAIALASRRSIPVFNLRNGDARHRLREMLVRLHGVRPL